MKILFKKEEDVIPQNFGWSDGTPWQHLSSMHHKGTAKVKKFGVILLEQNPIKRTVLVVQNGQRNYKRICIPYTQFLINYSVVEPNKSYKKYVYHGIAEQGLHVFMSSSPLSKISQKVYSSIFDPSYYGLICTDHANDYGVSFDTLKELCKFSASDYFSYPVFLQSNIVEILKNEKIENVSFKNVFRSTPLSINSHVEQNLKQGYISKEILQRPRVKRISRKNNDL